jgi:hypothetical protein
MECAIVGGHRIDDRRLATRALEGESATPAPVEGLVRQAKPRSARTDRGRGTVPTAMACSQLACGNARGLAHAPVGRLCPVSLCTIAPASRPSGSDPDALLLARHGGARGADEAAARGVDVRIMTPTLNASDNRLVQHASHYRLAPLLERGVRVYHFDHTLLHQKVWTIDREYALIGSTNFDERSFDLDDQVTLAVNDHTLVREIDERFSEHMLRAQLVDAERWKRRPASEQIGDALAYLLREQL